MRAAASVNPVRIRHGEQRGHVGSVLWPVGGALVLEQLSPTEKGHRFAAEMAFRTASPGGLELDTRDRGEEVDAVRRTSQLNHPAEDRQIVIGHSDLAEPEVHQDGLNATDVLRRGANQEVDVACVPRVPVVGNACPPTTRNSSPGEFNNPMNSLKSACSFAKYPPVALDELEQHVDARLWRHPGVVLRVRPVGVVEAAMDPDDALHTVVPPRQVTTDHDRPQWRA